MTFIVVVVVVVSLGNDTRSRVRDCFMSGGFWLANAMLFHLCWPLRSHLTCDPKIEENGSELY